MDVSQNRGGFPPKMDALFHGKPNPIFQWMIWGGFPPIFGFNTHL